MSRVKLTIATTDYDHFRDFRLGLVNAEGIDHTWLTLGHHEVFARFTFNREWDVSELSFAKFCAQVTRQPPDIIGLPVVCSRLFRFSSFYVNKNSKIRTAADLKGKTHRLARMGAHRRRLHARLAHRRARHRAARTCTGTRPAPTSRAASRRSSSACPRACELTRVADKSLSDMIAAGEIDCALIARPPNSFLAGHPDVVRLFPDYLADGGGLLRAHQGVADHAHHRDPEAGPRRASLGRAQSLQCLRRVEAPQPRAPARPRGLALSAGVAADLCAQDARPVRRRSRSPTGSRRTGRRCTQFLRYTHEQGIAHRHAEPEEIFPKGIMTSVRV